MRLLSLLSTVAFSAPGEAGSAAPVVSTPAPAPVATVLPATAAPKLSKPAKPVKPAAAKPAKPAKPVAEAAEAEPAVKLVPTARTAATIVANATNFGGVLSDRDHAYLAFYASFAGADRTKRFTLGDLANSGRRPAYNGSNKPHDAGIANRLRKAGIISISDDGLTLNFTKLGRGLKLIVA